MKFVSDTKGGKSISAWIVLRADGTEVATVRAYYSDGGTCLVNVFNCGKDNKSVEEKSFQHAQAGGGGYDKLVAALTGMEIDGHTMSDHCGEKLSPPKGGTWKQKAKIPKGYRLANWSKEHNGYTSCYREPGLTFLTAIGYRVIQAI